MDFWDKSSIDQKRDEVNELRGKKTLTPYQQMQLRDEEGNLHKMSIDYSLRNNGKRYNY